MSKLKFVSAVLIRLIYLLLLILWLKNLFEQMKQDTDMLSQLYIDYTGFPPSSVFRLPGAASGRKYYRLTGNIIKDEKPVEFNCIGVAGDTFRDCRAFVELAKCFGKEGIRVPEVYAVADDYMHYIQQDLGSVSLFDLINDSKKRGDGDVVKPIVKETLSELAKMQSVDLSVWSSHSEYCSFGIRQAMWDLNYFKYEYIRPSGIDIEEDQLEDDFERFAEDLCSSAAVTQGFMYRDFQSRNIMVHDSKPYFIDFQGGRLGPVIYDAVSFLWQAKAGFTDDFRQEMLEHYFEELSRLKSFSRNEPDERKSVNMFALFRTLQVLGAYGLRGLVERKAHFIESIPAALENLKMLIERGAADRYPELKRVCICVCNDSRFAKKMGEGLQITVFSFSYKKGYPADFTGNGGGFMFDCRGMHNPGRYTEYKSITGRDKAVIDFLEERGEVQQFVENAVKIVSPSIETYLRRGFSSLQIGFGCTGGQHRSVYCAEHTACILAEKFPSAHIVLIHREQGFETTL